MCTYQCILSKCNYVYLTDSLPLTPYGVFDTTKTKKKSSVYAIRILELSGHTQYFAHWSYLGIPNTLHTGAIWAYPILCTLELSGHTQYFAHWSYLGIPNTLHTGAIWAYPILCTLELSGHTQYFAHWSYLDIPNTLHTGAIWAYPILCSIGN